MSSVKMEDLLDLSIFKCLVCTRRLRYPIMQVGSTGNICQSCYYKTPYTDAVENMEVLALMDRLTFPCNYTKVGCTFVGSFRKTCKHEESCRFTGRLCPFVYAKKCDIEEHIHDIVSHIQQQHKDNIAVVNKDCITIKNPTEEAPDELYFVNVGGNGYLIRMVFKNETQEILYMFYRMNDNDIAKSVIFTSIAFDEMQERYVVISESELSFELNTENAFAVDIQKLRDLDFENEIRIVVKHDNQSKNGEDVNVPIVPTVWWQCSGCFQVAQEIHVTSEVIFHFNRYNCICASVIRGDQKTKKIDASELGIGFVFPCRSENCNQLIRGDNYYAHTKYQCHFKKHSCPLSCRGRYFSYDELIPHILEAHKAVLNPKMCSLGKTSICKAFVNNDDVFIQECNISSDNIFSMTVIKLTEPYWDDSYYWEVHIQPKVKTMSTVIIGDCAVHGKTKKLHIKEYLENKELTFTTYIKRI